MERKCKDFYTSSKNGNVTQDYILLCLPYNFRAVEKYQSCRQDQYILAMTNKSLQRAGQIDRLSLQRWFKNKYK